MEAVQVVQVVQMVPASQAVTGAANPVPTGADSGRDTVSPLFRMMFEQAAGAVAGRAVPSPLPTENLRPAGQRVVPLHLAGEAAGAELPGKEGVDSGVSVSPERREDESVPAGRKLKARIIADPEVILSAMGGGREMVTDGMPMWVMPAPPRPENRQPYAGTESSVTDGSPRREGAAVAVVTAETATPAQAGQVGNFPANVADTAPLAVLPEGKEVPAAGIVLPRSTEVVMSRQQGQPPQAAEAMIVKESMMMKEPMTVKEPSVSIQAEVEHSREALRAAVTATERQVKAAESLKAAEPRAAADIPEAVMAEPVVRDGASEANTPSPGRLTSPESAKQGESSDAAVKLVHEHGADKVVKGDREGRLQYLMQELKAEVKGETVVRQAPGGVISPHPSHTIGMASASRRYDAPAAVLPETAAGDDAVSAGEPAGHRPEAATLDAAGGLSGRKESFSSWNGRQQRHDAGTGEGTQTFSVNHGGFGNVADTVKGAEETRVTGEDGARLHSEILSQVRERLENHVQGNGDGRITLRLNPRDLGELQLNVRMEDRKMSIEVTAQNPVVKEALLQNLDQLKDTLSRQNIQMDRFEVATGTGQQGAGQSFREGRQSGNRQGGDTPYPATGYFREEASAVPVAGWESREHSLVDLRL